MQSLCDLLHRRVTTQICQQLFVYRAIIFHGLAHFLSYAVNMCLDDQLLFHNVANGIIPELSKITARKPRQVLPKAHTSLLDQVQQQNTVAGVFLGDLHHTMQTQIQKLSANSFPFAF